KLGPNYSVEKLMSENTLYPFYAPFVTKEKQQKIFEDVAADARGLFGRLGILPSKIDNKKGLYFCKDCIVEDIEKFGEPYVHREHQLPAIYYCPHHECILIMYPIDYKNFSRQGYIRLDKRIIDSLNLKDINDESEEY